MSDRELLELAAKAAAYEVRWHESWQCYVHAGAFNITSQPTLAGQRCVWVPLDDDGDALRLAVKLGIGVLYSDFIGEAEALWRRGAERLAEYGPDDPYAATRLAITRAAAEIGKEMP